MLLNVFAVVAKTIVRSNAGITQENLIVSKKKLENEEGRRELRVMIQIHKSIHSVV